jgi:DNA-binding CsgD family transcriptional regulator
MEDAYYSRRHIADIHFVYGFCNGNAANAVREYARRFPNRPTPNARTFVRIHLRLGENGIRRPVNERLISPKEENVLRLITEDPKLSVRRISNGLSLSRRTVWRILKREGLHPCHFQRVQVIREPDYATRSTFASWICRRMRNDPNFLKRILWTDEATFTRSGITNHRNVHLWLPENPHAVRPSSFQHEFLVNAWAGMINDVLNGPLILPGTINSARFLEFLRTQFFEAMLELPITYRARTILLLDGAPAHFAREVRKHLDENYSPWIGRGGTVAWPPRSPDLTLLDFFFWGTIKQKVYFEVPNTRED